MKPKDVKPDSVVRRFEADARSLVPVSDEIGGTVIYVHGRPAYYVLNGEWFEAVRGPEDATRDGSMPSVDPGPGMGTVTLASSEGVSTS